MSVDDTDLVSETINVNTGDPLTIPTLTKTQDGITAAQFEASTDSSVLNHYGISIAGANYNAMESPKTILETSENNATADVTAISLAAKLDLLTVPAVYSTTINFQMTANPLPDTLESAYAKANKQKATIGGQQYYSIQDMNSTICADVDIEDDELQVYDNRDNKIYWIAKLADGKCWMTQNLDLDLVHTANDADALYTHANTDLGWGSDHATNSWNPDRSTIPVTSIGSDGIISGWVEDYTGPYSVDVGNWYWTSTLYAEDCLDSETYEDLCNFLVGDTADKFFQSPTGSGMHGHVGNYYNWTAAIASNDSSSYDSSTWEDRSLNPQNSICPAGWKLPTTFNSSEDDFYSLVDEYDDTYLDITALNDDHIITANPLWFVRGGWVGGDVLRNPGNEGHYWSNMVSDQDAGDAISFSSDSTLSAYYFEKVHGLSVRCIAR